MLTEAAGYVGGALMLGGVSLLAPYLWDEISPLGQLAVALGVALLLVAAALYAGLPRAGITLSRRVAGSPPPLARSARPRPAWPGPAWGSCCTTGSSARCSTHT